MFFATHLFSCTSAASCEGRRAAASRRQRARRFCAALVLAMSYATAFTETLTIARLPVLLLRRLARGRDARLGVLRPHFVQRMMYARLDEVFDALRGGRRRRAARHRRACQTWTAAKRLSRAATAALR